MVLPSGYIVHPIIVSIFLALLWEMDLKSQGFTSTITIIRNCIV
ncbi:hypothetical protein CsSME_00046233 [Camellia sinensis var. sinensis]